VGIESSSFSRALSCRRPQTRSVCLLESGPLIRGSVTNRTNGAHINQHVPFAGNIRASRLKRQPVSLIRVSCWVRISAGETDSPENFGGFPGSLQANREQQFVFDKGFFPRRFKIHYSPSSYQLKFYGVTQRRQRC
jgi:hypothetical protein